MTLNRILAAGAVLVALSSCRSGPTDLDALTNPAPCPQASVLFDASRIVNFHGGDNIENVGFTGEILGVRSLCRYEDGAPIQSDLEIAFAFGRGPAAGAASHAYPYFVAVTRRDAAVITKETFGVQANFRTGQSIAYGEESIQRIIIPRASDRVEGQNFEIVVGFELSPEQLEWNRSGVRFRADVGAFQAPSN